MRRCVLLVSLAVCASAAAVEPCSAKGCRALDIAVAIDGSGSMARSFGRHPHGFYALMEVVRGWVSHELPLSGAKAGSVPGDHAEGARVGLVQFSTSAVVTPVGVGSEGRLTGNIGEVLADAAWHQAAYLKGRSNLEGALKLVGRMFEREAASGRQRVLLVLAGGRLSDVDRLGAARAHLLGLGVRIFAVVLRRHRAHTQVDREAQVALKPFTSGSHDAHFENVPLAEVSSLLATICNPASRWGSAISPCGEERKLCTGHTNEAACVSDSGCDWNAQIPGCEARHQKEASSCADHYNVATCVADAGCSWYPHTRACESRPASPCANEDNKAACQTVAGCHWNAEVPACEPRGTFTHHDKEPPCTSYSNEASCVTVAGCSWNGEIPACEAKGAVVKPGTVTPCASINNENACLTSTGCSWNGQIPACEAKGAAVKQDAVTPCASINNEAACLTASGCSWNFEVPACEAKGAAVIQDAVTPCASINNEAACLTAAGCSWNFEIPACETKGAAVKQETVTPCSSINNEVACLTAAGCNWNAQIPSCEARQ